MRRVIERIGDFRRIKGDMPKALILSEIEIYKLKNELRNVIGYCEFTSEPLADPTHCAGIPIFKAKDCLLPEDC